MSPLLLRRSGSTWGSAAALPGHLTSVAGCVTSGETTLVRASPQVGEPEVLVTRDGTGWEQAVLPDGVRGISALAAVPGGFVAVGRTAVTATADVLLTSRDGLTWSPVHLPIEGVARVRSLRAVDGVVAVVVLTAREDQVWSLGNVEELLPAS